MRILLDLFKIILSWNLNFFEFWSEPTLTDNMKCVEILSLNLEGLRAKLESLGLSKTGNKDVLQGRFLDHFNVDRLEKNSDYDLATIPFSNFTLRDVQDSVWTFSGDGLPEIGQWLNEFEDCSCAVRWNDLQKFIYAKQLLTSAARTFWNKNRLTGFY